MTKQEKLISGTSYRVIRSRVPQCQAEDHALRDVCGRALSTMIGFRQYWWRIMRGPSISVYFLPKYGRWSKRDQYEVMNAASEDDVLHDVFPNSNVEGGFSFPCPPGIYDDGINANDIRTYGCMGVLPQDWRSCLDAPDVDDRVPLSPTYDYFICLRCKWGPTLEHVVRLVHILWRLGHHIVRTEGFAMPNGYFNYVTRVGDNVRYSNIAASTARRLQLKLGVFFAESSYGVQTIDPTAERMFNIRKATERRDVMRVHMPYMLFFDRDAKTVYLVNRNYGPIGYDIDEEFTWWRYPTVGEIQYLYDDECTPWKSRRDLRAYLSKYTELVGDYTVKIGGFRRS